MQQAIVKAVPLALATALSSGLFLFMVLILMKKERQLKNGLAFLAGVLLALAAVGTIMLLAVKQADAAEPHKKTLASVVVDLALGGFLLGLLIKTTLFPVPEKVREPGAQSSKPRPLYQYFIGGVVMRLLSLDTMPPFIGVTKNIAMSHLPHAGQFAVLAFVMSVSVLPLALPLVFFAISPERTMSVLIPVRTFIERHKHALMAVVLAVLGVYFLVRGLSVIFKVITAGLF